MITDISKYRLGNLLREVNSKKIVQVIGLQKNLVKLKNPSADVHDFKIEVSGNFPDGWGLEEIPLKGDILQVLGFELATGREGYIFHKDDFILGLAGNVIFFENIHIKTVSHLQNLFCDINGYDLDPRGLNIEPIPESK